MRNWPEPTEDLYEWAKRLVTLLDERESDGLASPNVGQIGEFVSVPTGWLRCSATGTPRTFLAESYPALYQKLQTTTLPTLAPQYDASFVVCIKT